MRRTGPRPDHWFWGNINKIVAAEPGAMHAEWAEQYGPTFRYQMLFGGPRVCTADPVALNHILTHADSFPKPALTRKFLVDLVGDGVLVAEGATHRRQRRVLNPSFSLQSIKNVLPVFYDKAEELREKLLALIEDDPHNDAAPTPPKPEDVVRGARKIDVMKFLGMCTLDVIGVAGFNYDFKSLSQPKNELAEAFREMFSAGQNFNFVGVLQAFVPYADRIVSHQSADLQEMAAGAPADGQPTKRQTTIGASKALTQRIGRVS